MSQEPQEPEPVIVECKNPNCEWSGDWTALRSHLDECEYESVNCKYAEYGCKESSTRKEMKEHEKNDQAHLRTTIKAADELMIKVAQLEKQQDYILALLPKPSNMITHHFKMENFTQSRSVSGVFFSPSFYTSPKGFKMCARIYANGKDNTNGRGTHISVETCLMKGDNDDYLTWPFVGTVTFELLNQLKDRGHHKGTFTFPQNHLASYRVVDDEIATDGFSIDQFIGNTERELGFVLHRLAVNTEYLKYDSLYFRVSVLVPSYNPWLERTLFQ